MNKDITTYNKAQNKNEKELCDKLAEEIDKSLPKAESKIWHGSPVWFLEENPLVGYSVRKQNVQLLFWSGQSFKEPGLKKEGTFKAAQKIYTNADEIKITELKRWLKKAKTIQWDYKNIVKRKGRLVKIK